MRSPGRLLFAVLLPLLLAACGSPEPLGPAPLDEGIIIYMHSDFRGTSQQIASDVSNLGDVQGPCGTTESEQDRTWNDCISSLRILPGWGATLYGDRNFHGGSLTVTEDLTDLGARQGPCSGSYDDCITSIRVYRR